MTLLEFVCERLLGPPTRTLGNGQSHWPCPVCGEREFNTFPHKPEYKDRCRCWRLNNCGFRGDELDVIRVVIEQQERGDDWRLLEKLRDEYERTDAAIRPVGHPSSLRGGGVEHADALIRRIMAERAAVDEMVADLNDDERKHAIQLLKKLRDVAQRHGLPIGVLAEVWIMLHTEDALIRAAEPERVAELERIQRKLEAWTEARRNRLQSGLTFGVKPAVTGPAGFTMRSAARGRA
jgi:hypothetical protein